MISAICLASQAQTFLRARHAFRPHERGEKRVTKPLERLSGRLNTILSISQG